MPAGKGNGYKEGIGTFLSQLLQILQQLRRMEKLIKLTIIIWMSLFLWAIV